ncbi:isocitrate lyase/PEP mutase family protein [Peribacillus cavernae]|uniref:Isocitrate lyase/PEP mutase family protein n=1 Tax=Peribacillus cavernae TaxID=1674310 RepID=A0A433H6Q4_9BACI|nr:isocitrate lyase/PEP mutase family protein [Peribacillus cavernae]MDQ0221380.1 methylisocitrate lyase [Peribacillus cavernae]RUQ23978.1 isocitrate lyase/PEP mutase family protein [Peribacillus cavernae]
MDYLKRRIELRALLEKEQSIPVPGAYDAISAKLIEKEGFPVAYIGSYATASSTYGYPDVGLLGLHEMVSHAEKIVNAVSIPVIADAENGFTHAANIWRTIQAFENAGVSGIHIEDHEFGKHSDVPSVLLPLDQMVSKIKAAIDARKDPNFIIIARTDMIYALNNLEGAIERANAFIEAGADMVFLTGIRPDVLKEVRNQIKGKVVTVDSPGFTVADEKDAQANIVIYYGLCTYAAYAGVQKALKSFKVTQNQSLVKEHLADVEEFEDFMDYKNFADTSKKYNLV